jgi:hypothetical protein
MEISCMKRVSWSHKKFEGDWGKALENYIQRRSDVVPKEFFTGGQALKKMGLSDAVSGQRNSLLNQMVKAGALVKKHFRIVDASGRRISSIAHYALAK